MNEDNKTISAFAFNTGRLIEDLIIKETNNLQEENRMLQAKILDWYGMTQDDKFKEYFGIKTHSSGKIIEI